MTFVCSKKQECRKKCSGEFSEHVPFHFLHCFEPLYAPRMQAPERYAASRSTDCPPIEVPPSDSPMLDGKVKPDG